MAVVPWSPLAGGRCAHPWGTKIARNSVDEVSPMVWGNTDTQDKIVVDNLEQVAKEIGYSMAQTSLAWMLSKPFITAPIVGTTSVKHIEAAVSALDIALDDKSWKHHMFRTSRRELFDVKKNPIDGNRQNCRFENLEWITLKKLNKR